MTRPFRPRIDLSIEDAAKLRRAGFHQITVYQWRTRKAGPSLKSLSRINKILGRDACQSSAIEPTPVPPVISRVHIQVNPCVDDAVCLAVRNAAMRPVANTLLDSRREIPCTNCREGIRRAKAEAAKKTAHVGALVCDCGEPKSREAKTCQACASERKRSFRPQPCRGMKGALA